MCYEKKYIRNNKTDINKKKKKTEKPKICSAHARLFPALVSYHNTSASNMATGSDRRSLDPFGFPLGERMPNRKLRNIRPVEWCAHVQTEVAQYLP
jgi:hypothetical protein